jgi:hypothetical protein
MRSRWIAGGGAETRYPAFRLDVDYSFRSMSDLLATMRVSLTLETGGRLWKYSMRMSQA